MQPEEAIEIDHAVTAVFGTGNGDAGTHVVVRLLGVRDNDVEPVGSAALEQYDQALAAKPGARAAAGRLCGVDCAGEKAGNHAGADNGQRSILQEDSASNRHGYSSWG